MPKRLQMLSKPAAFAIHSAWCPLKRDLSLDLNLSLDLDLDLSLDLNRL